MALFWELNEMVLEYFRPDQEGIKKKLMFVVWSEFRKGVLRRISRHHRYEY